MGLSGIELFKERTRIIAAARKQNTQEDLLDVLLDGEEKSLASVLQLRAFVVVQFRDDSPFTSCPIRTACLAACDAFLVTNGVTPPETPEADVKASRNILDEMDEDERRMNERLQA